MEKANAKLREEEKINGEIRGRVDDKEQIGEFPNAFLEIATICVLRT